MSIIARSTKNLQVEILAGNHTILADEPIESDGDDMGPAPYEFLLTALAGCKVMTVLLYARRKGWPVEGVSVTLHHTKVAARDCEGSTSPPNSKIDLIDTEISFEGDLDDAQVARLADISTRCPVHRTLTSETMIRTAVV
jgi:putative redox protein